MSDNRGHGPKNDPDVPEGACICRSDDAAMAMGHTHYCVSHARATAFGSRLPAAVEDALVALAADKEHAEWRRRRLDFNGDTGMRDTFLDALRSPAIAVHVDQCEDDPCEIVVRATGEGHDGSRWSDLNIALFDPWWSKSAKLSTALAEDIVNNWDVLCETLANAKGEIPAKGEVGGKNLGFYYTRGIMEGRARLHSVANRVPTTVYEMAGAFHGYEGEGPGEGRFGKVVTRYDAAGMKISA